MPVIPSYWRGCGVFIWDNSPAALVAPAIPFPHTYRHNGRNAGTSGAYNEALQFAESMQAPWLLLLDQDTSVSPPFVPRMLEYSDRFAGTTEVGTVVGFIYSHGVLVSPRRLLRFNRIAQIPASFDGLHKQKAYAVNSATLMRVSALRAIGGYSDEFWLDLSDVYVFQAMHRRGQYMYIAGDLRLDHSIASMDFDNEMSPERYRNFIAAESAYVDFYSAPWERPAQLLRLFVRTLRQYRRYQNKAFARISWEYFCRRLLQSRTQRLQGWRKQLAQRDIPVVADGQVVG